MEPSYIQESQEIYNFAEPEYERYFYDENTGGFVLIHQDHNTNDSERFVAEAFAVQGKRVKLLSEQAHRGLEHLMLRLMGNFGSLRNSVETQSISAMRFKGVLL